VFDDKFKPVLLYLFLLGELILFYFNQNWLEFITKDLLYCNKKAKLQSIAYQMLVAFCLAIGLLSIIVSN